MIQKRLHKVKSDYGIRDYYKFYKENSKSKIDYNTYNKVALSCFDQLMNLVINNNYTWRLPSGLGRICVSKRPTSTTFKNGKLVTNRPINFKATKELWNNNSKAKKNKTLVYYENFHTDGYVLYIRYSLAGSNFKNKNYYKIKFNRAKKRALAQNIFSGNFDTLIEDKYI